LTEKYLDFLTLWKFEVKKMKSIFVNPGTPLHKLSAEDWREECSARSEMFCFAKKACFIGIFCMCLIMFVFLIAMLSLI
jgi:hypothetical protein